MNQIESQPVPIVGIGASAGGLEAIRTMLHSASEDVGMAFVVIQHLDPNHESLLAELLSRQTALAVRQISGAEVVQANHVYIIPPGHGLRIDKGKLTLTEFDQPRGLRRPIDDFFESLARDQGGNAAGVILSGTGADGTSGLRLIKQYGGVVIAQDPDTARYDGMPVSAVGTGLVDFVREPGQIIATLSSFFDRRRDRDELDESSGDVPEHLDEMAAALRESVGHDFSQYKRSTLVRRIERRMQVLGIKSPIDYLYRLKSDQEEGEALFRDLLINVTRFFRDRDAFEVLRRRVIEPLVANAAKGGEVRVWVPGCSSGEEAYSIAILFAAALKGRHQRPMVQIFATDIDEAMLKIAREGKYPIASITDIPVELRDEFTIANDQSFHIGPKVRDLIRFSSHSLIKDPPFSKLNLVSCRNLLIYFGEKLQQQVFPILHYAIQPGGHLFLGPSESIGRHEHMFSVVDQKSRLYERLQGRPIYPLNLPASVGRQPQQQTARTEYPAANRMRWEESLSVRRIVDRYSPASMVLDSEGEIISSNGRLAKYFEFPQIGTTSTFAASIARPGLREVLAPLLRQAFDQHRRVVVRDIAVQAEFGTQRIDVIADPLPDGTALLIFRDNQPFEPGSDEDMTELGPADSALQQVEEELRMTRHRLRSTVEELETANEELKSSNEEMMSMNEELQSTNEELSTVNDELVTKVDLLSIANADLRNFFESTQLAVIVLDTNLRIRTYTDATMDIYPLQEVDKGRALADVASNLEKNRILDDARSVLQDGKSIMSAVSDTTGEKHWSVRLTPYRVLDDTIGGVTIVFNEVTESLRMKAALETESERLNLAVQVAGIGIWEYNIDTGEAIMDHSEQALLGLHGVESDQMLNVLEIVLQEDRPHVEESLRKASAGVEDFQATFRIALPGGEMRTLRGLGRLVPDSRPRRIVGVTYDITPEARLADQREYMIREMNHRVKNLFAIISGLLTTAARTAGSPTELAENVRSRILALGRAHGLTQESDRSDIIDLEALIRGTLEPYEDVTKIRLSGKPATVHSTQLTPLALILHEWATNAYKYGVLGPKDGTLTIAWEVPEEARGMIDIVWTEGFFQENTEPESGEVGFGSRLVAFSVAQLEATTETHRDTSERRITLRMPTR